MSRPPLSPETVVFRAVRSSWALGGDLHATAFLVRPDETGLSVSESRTNALAALKNVQLAASLVTGEVRNVGLDVGPKHSLTDPLYCWIIGIPSYTSEDDEGKARANDYADLLRRVCRFPA